MMLIGRRCSAARSGFARYVANAAPSGAKGVGLQGQRVVYRGGFDNMLRILKRVSVFSCACTLVGVPLLAYSSNNPRMKGVQKWAVAFVVVAFGVTTTAALHIVAKPYVCKLMIDATGDLLTIETMNMLGRTKTTKLDFNKVTRVDKPWATFGSSVDPSVAFFVEESPDAYSDLQFRAKLFSKIGLPTS